MKTFKIILLNVLVTLLLLEGGTRLYYALGDDVPPHADLSVTREWRWVKARLADGKVNFDQRFAYDANVGWRNAPNIDVTPDRMGAIRTNSAGMRNHQEFTLDKPAGKRRLMIVGDSYSFGHGVSNDETYAYQLAALLPDWEVMNYAVSATGTDQNYLMYEHYGKPYKPDVVVLGFYALDYNRNTYSFRDYAKPMFVPMGDDGSLMLTHVPVPTPEALLEDYRSGRQQIGGWHYSYALAVFKRALADRIKRDRDPGSLGRRTLTGIMERFVASVRAEGGTPVWVNFPIRDVLDEEESKYAVITDFAVAEAKRLGMPVIDMGPVFVEQLAKHPEVKTFWRPEEVGGHMNAEGNRLTAFALRDLLQREGMLK